MTKIWTILILYFIFHTSILSQCNDQVRLDSQVEVDSFRIKYGNCKKLLWLVLDGRSSPIYNLDSLYALEEVPFLELRGLDSLRPYASFKNLKVSQELGNSSGSKNLLFPNLEKVQILYHTFPDSSQDLSIYKNIKYIKSRIHINGNGKLKGLGNYTTSSDFNILISACKMPNFLRDILPDELDKLETLSISFCNNFSTQGCEKIKEISRLFVGSSLNCDLSGISKITSLKVLDWYNINSEDIKLEQFQFIDSIENLFLGKCKNIYNINQLLPNLKNISVYLTLEENTDLEAVNLLNNFSLPRSKNTPIFLTTPPQPYRIIIRDNPLLYHCDIDFICKALTTYPDSVLISGNSPDCNKIDLISQCVSGTEDDVIDTRVQLYPSPSSGIVHISSSLGVTDIDVKDITGKQIYTSYARDQIDVSAWQAGIFLMSITLDDGSKVVRKVVRSE